MAVVQISRIQIRRGQKNSGTGIPQLASGEMAWAVDAQQLYIGNGSVAEGAPTVGITKILTEKDLSAQGNLLGLLQYTYKANDPTILTGLTVNSPVSRSLQNRLDDALNALDFGTVADGSTDDTVALQRAIDQTFLNINNSANTFSLDWPTGTPSAVSSRDILLLPAGIYKTKRPIYIPSYTTLVGAGIDKTIIQYDPTYTLTSTTTLNSTTVLTSGANSIMVGAVITGANIPANSTVVSVVAGVSLTFTNTNGINQQPTGATATSATATVIVILNLPAIRFINDTSTPGNPSIISSSTYINQPKNIRMSGITINSVTGLAPCLQLDAVRDSTFENIKLSGNITVPGTLSSNAAGIIMNAYGVITCENNVFSSLIIEGTYYGVYAKYDMSNNVFLECQIGRNNLTAWVKQGFVLGDGIDGSSDGQKTGPIETQIVDCKFINVKEQAVLVFNGSGNAVRNCRFLNVGNDGSGDLYGQYPMVYFNSYGNYAEGIYSNRQATLAADNFTSKYIPEVTGHGIYKLYGTSQATIGYQAGATPLFRLPVKTDYSGNAGGTITYTIDYHYTSGPNSFGRRGTIKLVADVLHNRIQLSDEYDYAGTDPGITNALLLDFSATYLDSTGVNVSPNGTANSDIYAILISYTNPSQTDYGYLNYSYTANF